MTMCMYIGIEDLAANALISLLMTKSDEPCPFVSFSTLKEYGLRVVTKLREQHEEAVYIYSPISKARLFSDYSNYFELAVRKGKEGVRLREGVGLEDLWIKFQTVIAVKMLRVMRDPELLRSLRLAA